MPRDSSKLQIIVLVGMECNGDVFQFVERWCTRITSLSMEDSYFSDLDHFVEFLLTFTSLERLVLDSVQWKAPSIVSQSCITSDLRTLIIRHCLLADLLPWFLSHERLPPLHTLSLCSIIASEIPDVSRLLARLGPSLRHLELKFHIDIDEIFCECMLSHIFALSSCLSSVSLSRF